MRVVERRGVDMRDAVAATQQLHRRAKSADGDSPRVSDSNSRKKTQQPAAGTAKTSKTGLGIRSARRIWQRLTA